MPYAQYIRLSYITWHFTLFAIHMPFTDALKMCSEILAQELHLYPGTQAFSPQHLSLTIPMQREAW